MSRNSRKSKGDVPSDSVTCDTTMSIPIDEKPLGEINLADLLRCSPGARYYKRIRESGLQFLDVFRAGSSMSIFVGNPPRNSEYLSPGLRKSYYGLNRESPSSGLHNVRQSRDPEEQQRNLIWEPSKSPLKTGGQVTSLESLLSIREVIDSGPLPKRICSQKFPPTFVYHDQMPISLSGPESRSPRLSRKIRRKCSSSEAMVSEVTSTVSHL